MKKLDAYNMPENKLYQFDSNRFFWKIRLDDFNYGNNTLFTEVYEKNDNMLKRIANGVLIDDYDSVKANEFKILDNDFNTVMIFEQTMPLKEADVEILCLFANYLRQGFQNTKRK